MLLSVDSLLKNKGTGFKQAVIPDSWWKLSALTPGKSVANCCHLLHGDAFSQVPREVYGTAPLLGGIVGKQLQGYRINHR